MESNGIKTIAEAFEQAMRWEAMAEKFYATAAERFAGDPQQLLLLQLAEEEASHQLDLKQMAARAHGIAQEFISTDNITSDISRMDEILEAGSMLDVANFALQMEESAVRNYDALASRTQGELKAMLLELYAFEKRHVELIKNMIRDLEIDPGDDWEEIHSH